MHSDTIFALSSASGRAGVAVIRLSGARARHAISALSGGEVPPRRACLRCLRDPFSGEIVDEGVILFFPGPRSFTGEDVAEFQVHGSLAVIKRLVAILGSFEGCRPAEPGEFTRRAFLNGRMDLIEVEALGDLLLAETESQRRFARDGSRRLRLVAVDWRERLIEERALCEAHIDFSDEGDVALRIDSVSQQNIAALRAEIDQAVPSLAHGRRVRNGFKVAVLGPVNAGKSTLVNALADREVSITSPSPGTTRDVVETHVELAGQPFVIYDTAGIRPDAADAVEAEGMRRSWGAAEGADLVLWVSAIDSVAECPNEDWMPVVSKADLSSAPRGDGRVYVSTLTGEGIAGLVELIHARCRILGGDGAQSLVLAHERQAAALRFASRHLSNALAFCEATLDMRAEELRLACAALDALIGRVSDEDVLDQVFARFCIGK